MRTLRFLRDDDGWVRRVEAAFAEYRDAIVRGVRADGARETLRQALLQVMARTERPMLGRDGMLVEDLRPMSGPSPDDIRGYVALRRLAEEVNAPATLEYWKSAPYFVNFTEGYQLGQKLRDALAGTPAPLASPLQKAQLLDNAALGAYAEIDLGNSRLRQLAGDTIEQGWWRLLWVPPSMPHYQLGGDFGEAVARGMTKRLVFSSWSATPTSIAGLLSYEAERRIVAGRLRSNTAEARRGVATRLDYRVDDGRPAAMSTLALFWPHPALAQLGDPLAAARAEPDQLPQLADVESAIRAVLLRQLPADLTSPEFTGEVQPWNAVFRWPGAVPEVGFTREMSAAGLGGHYDPDAPDVGEPAETGLERHVANAFGLIDGGGMPAAKTAEDVIDDLVALSLHAPGNIAWRALGRLLPAGSRVSPGQHWPAAAILASGLRSLFNRLESTMLLDQLGLDAVHWRAVLRYSAQGGLQAVLDEYLHHLRAATSDVEITDTVLLDLACQARDALAIRPSVYRAFNPLRPREPIPLLSRFALRYGGRRDDAEGARQPEIRAAFNSPFWPFVLATTSAGQEGIDFHWWCSAVVHWNTPANPVDFEQREGRVHRFGGHAVRRNVAARHRADALRSAEPDVWKAAYDAAQVASSELGDFAPYWIYPGPAKVERHLLAYPLSRDVAKIGRLKADLATYRLAFGQPRQEDMLRLLHRHGVAQDGTVAESIDLRPPRHR